MERHPVPQNIMDVEFKLFGSLTITQFGYLAGGIIIALLIYVTGIPEIVKYILVGFSLFMGFFLSLIKVNGQASSTWVSNFIIALLNSQSRVWRKRGQVPEMLKERPVQLPKPEDELLKDIRKDPARISAIPLEKLAAAPAENIWDKQEEERLQQIEKHFEFAMKNLPDNTPNYENPRKAGSFSPVKSVMQQQQPVVNSAGNLAGNITEQPQGEPVYIEGQYTAIVNPIKAAVNRPIGSSSGNNNKLNYRQANAGMPAQGNNPGNGNAASQNFHILKGKVTDLNGTPLSKVNLAVLDSREKLLRKTITNARGEFFFTNPLANGLYYIDLQDAQHKFDRQTVELTGNRASDFNFESLN